MRATCLRRWHEPLQSLARARSCLTVPAAGWLSLIFLFRFFFFPSSYFFFLGNFGGHPFKLWTHFFLALVGATMGITRITSPNYCTSSGLCLRWHHTISVSPGTALAAPNATPRSRQRFRRAPHRARNERWESQEPKGEGPLSAHRPGLVRPAGWVMKQWNMHLDGSVKKGGPERALALLFS